jgi:hypothetical protein
MSRQRILVWTGEQPERMETWARQVDALPPLPPPTPLRRAGVITYQWGEQKFEVYCTACSLRTTAWGEEQVTWLHCKGMQTVAIEPEEPTDLMNVLIPSHYVTGIQPGPTFRLMRCRTSDDIGLFPPNQPTPAFALPLEIIERVLTELLVPERN